MLRAPSVAMWAFAILLAGGTLADEPPAPPAPAAERSAPATAPGAERSAPVTAPAEGAPSQSPKLTEDQIKRLNEMADEAAAIVAPNDKHEQIRIKLDLMAAIERQRTRQKAAGHLAKVKQLLAQAEEEARLALSLGAPAGELPELAPVLRMGTPTLAAPRSIVGPSDDFVPPPDDEGSSRGGPLSEKPREAPPPDQPPVEDSPSESDTSGGDVNSEDPPLDASTPAERPPDSAAFAEEFFSDPVWLENMDALMRELGPEVTAPRIVGTGINVRPTTDVLDCVYIGIAPGSGRGACLCTGTLISSRIVVTAAHCVTSGPNCTGRASHIFVCNDVSAGNKRRFEVQRTVAHPQYSGAPYFRNDIALLVLTAPVPGVTPRKFATAREIDTSKGFLAMGFGKNNAGQTGTKMEGYVAVRSAACRMPGDNRFGCFPGQNLIAGGYGFGGADSCNGDSGGPCFYMGRDKRLYLAGLTSRGLPNLPCGGGGCYVRVDFFEQWIKDTMRSLGATQAELDYVTDGQPATGNGR